MKTDLEALDQVLYAALRKRSLRMGKVRHSLPVDEAEAMALRKYIEASGFEIKPVPPSGLTNDAAKVSEMPEALLVPHEMEDDHPRIWLEPKARGYASDGRMWCHDRVWDDGVEYVHVSQLAAANAEIESLRYEREYFRGLSERHADRIQARYTLINDLAVGINIASHKN